VSFVIKIWGKNYASFIFHLFDTLYFLKMLCSMNVCAYIYGHDICQYPLHTLFMTQIFAYKDKVSIFWGWKKKTTSFLGGWRHVYLWFLYFFQRPLNFTSLKTFMWISSSFITFCNFNLWSSIAFVGYDLRCWSHSSKVSTWFRAF
jgi:hypothetical protein